MNSLRNTYLAPPKPGRPEDGWGIYEHATGRCLFYSDGGTQFFHMATGKPAFYVHERKFYADGIWLDPPTNMQEFQEYEAKREEDGEKE